MGLFSTPRLALIVEYDAMQNNIGTLFEEPEPEPACKSSPLLVALINRTITNKE